MLFLKEKIKIFLIIVSLFFSMMSLLILAGGLGSRYNGMKQIDTLNENDETLMEFALYDALHLGIRKFVFIINSHFPESYQKKLNKLLTQNGAQSYFVLQTIDSYIPEIKKSLLTHRTKPLGTAHAVYCAKEIIKEPFITMNADDFYGRQSFKMAINYILQERISDRNWACIAFLLKNTLSNNGGVSRGECLIMNSRLKEVNELTQIQYYDGQLKGKNVKNKWQELSEDLYVSMNLWVLHPSIFQFISNELEFFLNNIEDSLSSEIYLPSVIDQAIKNSHVQVDVIPSKEQWQGLTYQEDKEKVKTFINRLKVEGDYPTKLWV